MTTEINKEYENAVKLGYPGSRSKFIAERKEHKSDMDKWVFPIHFMIAVLVITALVNIAGSSFVDFHINHTISKIEYWLITFSSIFIGLLTLVPLFKKDIK